jgi:hypothetical protein
MLRTWLPLVFLLAMTGCSPTPDEKRPVPLTPPADVPGAAVVRRPVPEPGASAAAPPAAAAPKAAEAAVVIPEGALYVCVADKDGVRQTTAIEFAPKVGVLCAKAPEMGPCQYERNVCRGSGGRVYAANGMEITMQTEAEYDKKVMRVRLKSN